MTTCGHPWLNVSAVVTILLGLTNLASAAVEDLLELPREQRQIRMQELFSASQPKPWPAEASLTEALAKLRQPDQSILLPLGLGGLIEPAPPVAATWWESLLAICASHGLEVAPPRESSPLDRHASGSPLALIAHNPLSRSRTRTLPPSGGALLLRRTTAEGLPMHASGPLLLRLHHLADERIRGLRSTRRAIELGLELRLEPRLPVELVQTAALQLKALDEQGQRAIAIDAQDDPLADLLLLPGTATEGPDWLRLLRFQVAEHASTLRLRGTIELRCGHVVERELRLRPGQQQQLVLPDRKLEIHLASTDGIGKLTLTTTQGDLPPELVLLGPDGQALRSHGSQFQSVGTNIRIERSYQHLAEGEHRVLLQVPVHLGRIELPVDWEIPLP